MKKDCNFCENRVTDKVCCGDEKNGMVDSTGEKKCFKPDFLGRMELEGKELEERLENATKFLNTVYDMPPKEKEAFFKEENIDDGDLDLLQAQTTAMATYANILRIRCNIERAKRHLPTIAKF